MKKINKSSILNNKIIHHLIYIVYLIIVIGICIFPMFFYEKIFNVLVITYITLLFNLFVDTNPPKYARILDLITKGINEECDSKNEYLDDLTLILENILRSISVIKKIDEKEDNSMDNIIYNLKIIIINKQKIEQLYTPLKYKEKQENILENINEFIEIYKEAYGEEVFTI